MVSLVMTEVLSPIIFAFNILRFIGILFIDIVKPIFYLVVNIFNIGISLLKLIFYLPIVSLSKIFALLKDGIFGVLLFIKGVFSFIFIGINMAKGLIIPAARTTIENRETTFNLL